MFTRCFSQTDFFITFILNVHKDTPMNPGRSLVICSCALRVTVRSCMLDFTDEPTTLPGGVRQGARAAKVTLGHTVNDTGIGLLDVQLETWLYHRDRGNWKHSSTHTAQLYSANDFENIWSISAIVVLCVISCCHIYRAKITPDCSNKMCMDPLSTTITL